MSDSQQHEAFAERLRVCISKAGTTYALAKRSGIGANTIRMYLDGSEPTRAKLELLAEASGVSPSWLAFGAESPCAIVQKPKKTGIDQEFKSRLARLIEVHGGLQASASHFGVEQNLIERMFAPGPVAIEDISALASCDLVPIRWLISDSPGYVSALLPQFNESMRRLASQISRVDDERLYSGHPISAQSTHPEDASWREPVYSAMGKLYGFLPPANYKLYELSGALPSQIADLGSIAIVDENSENPSSGYCVFEELPPKGDFLLIHALYLDGIWRVDDRRIHSEPGQLGLDRYRFRGRAIALIRRF